MKRGANEWLLCLCQSVIYKQASASGHFANFEFIIAFFGYSTTIFNANEAGANTGAKE